MEDRQGKDDMKKLVILSMCLSSIAFAAEWNYENENQWPKLCQHGGIQSPIDIKANMNIAALPELTFSYGEVENNVQNNGHTLQVDVTKDYGFTVTDGEIYKLLQLHFHTPSEYAIEGEKFPMELHFVHQNNEGNLGVIGVMLKEGGENEAVEKIWKIAPVEKGEAKGGERFDLNDLLPEEKNYFRFMGSLTTPPCSEGVNWFMLKEPLFVSAKQIEYFRNLYPMNARSLQDVNHRLIIED